MNLRFQPPLSGVVASVGSLFGLNKKGDGEEDAKVIDVDDEGKVLYKEDIIQKIRDDLEQRKTERKSATETKINSMILL